MYIYAILVLLPVLALAQNDTLALQTKLFDALDANKDGNITLAETEAYFLSFDADKDGEISRTEFVDSVDHLDPAFLTHEDILYQLFDRDHTGNVTKADIDAVFDIADINNDGIVIKIEFHIVFTLVLSDIGNGSKA